MSVAMSVDTLVMTRPHSGAAKLDRRPGQRTPVLFAALAAAFCALAMSSAAALAAPPEPYLVKDIYPGSNSSPRQLTDVGGTLYFSATDPTNGEEL